jgi:hypothetical protein
VGAADFNGDGMADLLWKSASTGQMAMWEMNGTAIQASAFLPTVATEWHVAGTGDFDGDGKADILLRDQVTGAAAIWEMNGTAIKSAAIITAPPLDWQVAGVADLNGDGKSDIIWKNAATGGGGVGDERLLHRRFRHPRHPARRLDPAQPPLRLGVSYRSPGPHSLRLGPGSSPATAAPSTVTAAAGIEPAFCV